MGKRRQAIAVWKPVFTFMAGETADQAVIRLLSIFRCVLVPREDNLCLKVCEDGDGVDYTYTTPSGAVYHPYLAGQSQSVLGSPMKVVARKIVDISDDPVYSSEYVDPDWTADMGYYVFDDPYGVVTSNDDCKLVAESIVRRAKSQQETGMIRVPVYNCLVEIYDKVVAEDNRGNTGTGDAGGRVGGIYFYYPARRDQSGKPYTMEIRLGGLLRSLATDVGGLTQQMNIEVAQRGGLIRPHSITPDLLVNAMQKFVVDMNWSSTGKTNATWGGGTVTFGDGQTRSLDAGSKSDLDDTHVDFAYFVAGDDGVHWTHNFGETIGAGRGLLAACAGGKTGDAGAYIKTSNGKADVINASMVICDYLSTIVAHLGDVDTADGAVRINDSGNRSCWGAQAAQLLCPGPGRRRELSLLQRGCGPLL